MYDVFEEAEEGGPQETLNAKRKEQSFKILITKSIDVRTTEVLLRPRIALKAILKEIWVCGFHLQTS